MEKSEKETRDAEIIDLFFNRDESGISRLRETYEKTLKQLAVNYLKDSRDVEECLWDVYFAVWESIPPKKPTSLLSYLCTLLRNASLNRIREKKCKKRGEGLKDIPWENCEEFIGVDQEMDRIEESRQILEILREYLNTVTDRRHNIFMARYYFGKSIRDIPRPQGIGKSTVNAELAAIRLELRKKMEEGGITL